MIKTYKLIKEYIFRVNNLIYWLILYLFELLFFKIKKNLNIKEI